MQDQLTQTIELSVSDTDAHGLWKPSSILRHMQEMGETHCAQLGFPRSTLLEKDMCWVLSRVTYRLAEKISLGDRLEMTTWPGGIAGPFFPRYFVWEKDGTPAGEAAAAWVLFDIKNRRLLRPCMLPAPYTSSSRESALAVPGALAVERCAPHEIRQVRFTDLDVNGHMNNARYADWISDLAEGRSLRALQINYLAEAYLNDRIALEYSQDAFIIGVRERDDRIIFEACVTFDD